EIAMRKQAVVGKSERIRSRNFTYATGQTKWSTSIAALSYEVDEEQTEEMDEEETIEEEAEDGDAACHPQWILFNAVRDTPHSEPFIRLPSRRAYPDYYEEIKCPISLAQI